MKKIPTLFHRVYEGHKIVDITSEVTPGFEWVLNGEGIATVKKDGSCCAIINGLFYKRYDAKKGKNGSYKLPPEGAIPCCDPDPITGHWPHWVLVKKDDPADKWFVNAYSNNCKLRYSACLVGPPADATYEAIGPHFQKNPYHLSADVLTRHGEEIIILPDRSFEGIRSYLESHRIEGIVFWKDGEPQCKIKRSDFGFEWPYEYEDSWKENK